MVAIQGLTTGQAPFLHRFVCRSLGKLAVLRTLMAFFDAKFADGLSNHVESILLPCI